MIDIRQVKFSPKSMVDDFGRVFFYNNKVYRAIYKESITDCLDLLKSAVFKEFIFKGLIPKTIVSDINIPGFELVLEHETLIEIQQHEWSFEMFKESALTVLKVNEICNNYGYELKDAHTFNVLFRGTTPVYADIGSITKKSSKTWIAYKEFICVFYIPLQFWKQNELYIVRKLVESNFYRMQTAPSQDILDSMIIGLINDNPIKYHMKFRNMSLFTNARYSNLNSIISLFINKGLSYIFKRPISLINYSCQIIPKEIVKKKIEKLSSNNKKSEWEGYHQSNYNLNGVYKPSPRFLRILEILKKFESEIETIIDLAGNEGYFTKLLLERTETPKIFLADYDSNAIDFAYKYFKSMNTNRVSVLLLNFIFTPEIENTAVRFKSDAVLALAVTHHLILTQKYSIDVIFERLKLFSKKYVFIEFMPLGLWSSHTQTGEIPPDWYNIKWFKLKFEVHFDLIFNEILEENRVLFVGKIKT